MNKDRPKNFLQAIFFFVLLFVVCLSIRIGWLRADGEAFLHDPDAYQSLAEGLSISGIIGRVNSEGNVQPTAYRPPGYIWCISLFVTNGQLNKLAVASVHVFLGVATCLMTARIAYLFSCNLKIAFLIAFCIAIDPILIKQSSLIMTETIATFVAILLWWIWVELVSTPRLPWLVTSWMFALGILAGLGCLVRPTNLAWCVVWIAGGVFLLVVQRYFKSSSMPESRKSHFAARDWLLLLLGIGVVLFPWALRNKMAIGKWTATTTHGGYTLLLANNPVLFDNIRTKGWSREWDESLFHHLWDRRRYEDPREPSYWNRTTDDLSHSSLDQKVPLQYGRDNEHPEVKDDRLANEVALVTIRNSPGIFLQSCLMRFSWFWAIAPYRSTASNGTVTAIGTWYILLYCGLLGAVVTAIREIHFRRLSPLDMIRWLPAVTLVVSLVLVHSIFWSNMRMRAPIMPVLYIWAGLFWLKLAKQYSEKST